MGEHKRQRHGREYTYYRSSGRKGDCARRYVREEALTAMVQDRLRDLHMDDDVAELLRLIVRDMVADSTKHLREERKRLRANVRRLEGQLDRALAAYTDGLADSAQYLRTTDRLRADRAEAEHRLAVLGERRDLDGDTAVGLIEVARGAADVLPRLAPEVQRALVRFYGATWLLAPDAGSVAVRWADPWPMLNRTPEVSMGSGFPAELVEGWASGSPGRVRTCGQSVNSRLLYH